MITENIYGHNTEGESFQERLCVGEFDACAAQILVTSTVAEAFSVAVRADSLIFSVDGECTRGFTGGEELDGGDLSFSGLAGGGEEEDLPVAAFAELFLT